MPYNYILFNDSREPLVEIVAQILCVTLEQNINLYLDSQKFENFDYTVDDLSQNSNLFINYLTRLHRDEVGELRIGITIYFRIPFISLF